MLIEFIRISMYLIVLAIGLASYLLQPGFVNWSFLGPFYALISIGFLMHLILVSKIERVSLFPKILFLSFVVDALLFSQLVHFSGMNQSLFLFIHLVNILISGLMFQASGALLVSLFTSIFFTAVAIFSAEMKAMNFLFLLALNNIAFFSVAGLSGYLGEQLQNIGAELSKTGLSLKASLEFNRALVENMPLGMISFKANGEVIQFNEFAQNLFKGTIRNWFDLFPKYKISDDFIRMDQNFKTADGEDKILNLSISKVFSPIFSEYIFIALIDDLTKIRQLEYSARQNEKLAAIGGLAAGIAHEIRNPLAGISGSIELLSQNTTHEDDKKLMKIILREIDRLNNLITEFLDYSRPEQAPTEKVDMVSILSECIDNMKSNTKVRQDVTVKTDWLDRSLVLAHADKMKQVFLNIILNSYQAMQDAAQPELVVQTYRSENELVIKIRDSGCGMKPDTLKRMFEPFHTTKAKGTGLGLAVTHKILEGHKARVFVTSEVGKGTEFILHFPIAQSEIN